MMAWLEQYVPPVKKQQAQPEQSENHQRTCHIEINTLDMPNERVKLSTITLDDVAINGHKIFLNQVDSMYPYDPANGPRDEALIEPPPPEDLTPYFRPEDLDRVVPKEVFSALAKAFDKTSQVKWLTRKLQQDGPMMTDIQGFEPVEAAYQLLTSWHRIFAKRATVRVLVQALCLSFNQTQCWVVKDFLDKERRGEIAGSKGGSSKGGSSKEGSKV